MKWLVFLSFLLFCGCATSPNRTPAQAPAQASKEKEGNYQGFGKESVSAKELEQYAPKPIDPVLRSQIETMLDTRAPSGGALTPDGKNLFFTWNVTGTRQIWKMNNPDAFPTQMTAGENNTILSAITPDGQNLILARDQAGDEFYGIYLQSVKGGALETIYKQAKVRAQPQVISPDGRYLFFIANSESPSSFAIHRYDFKEKKSELIYSEPGQWRVDDIHKDGTLLINDAKSNYFNEYFLYNPEKKTKEPLLGQDEKELYDAMWAPDGKNFFVATHKFGDFIRLYFYTPADKKFEPITADAPMDVKGFRLNRKDRTLLGVSVNDKGYGKVSFYNIKGLTAHGVKKLKPMKLPDLPKNAVQIELGSITPDGRWAMLNVETTQVPNLQLALNIQTKQLRQWGSPSNPELSTKDFVNAALDFYTARDGTRIPMFVWRGPNCEKKVCPVIVDFHGGPEAQSRPGFRTTLQLFLRAGFVYVAPNVRGSDGYGKAWSHADDGPKRLDVLTDIADASVFIKKNWAMDGHVPKVGVMGGSYGGFATLVAMSQFAGIYDAGVAIVGMSDLRTFLSNTAPYRAANRASEYGDLKKDAEALEKLSPAFYVDQVQGPLLIIHGAQDPRVPVGEALQFHKKLRARNVPAELIIFPDEGHGVSKRPNRVLNTGYLIDFFKRNLQ